jgi:hypothetical protein
LPKLDESEEDSALNRVCGIFSQILQLISRTGFDTAVRKHKAERHARGFSSWGQFVAMLFCQLGGAKSLREICGGLAASEGKLRHLGLPQAPARHLGLRQPASSVAVIRRAIPAASDPMPGVGGAAICGAAQVPLQTQADQLGRDGDRSVRQGFRLGAVKLHLLLDHDGFLPCYAVITEGKQHEIGVARQLRYEPGTLLVMDRGYNDYSWFADLSQQGVYFVTRMKDNADYVVLEERELPHRKGLLRDQVICFYQQARDGQECYFRRIEFYDEEQDRVLVFVTNHLTLAAATVAEVYKQRWQIELFFRALKQNLRVKTFIGTSANALQTQVWAALIAMLLIKYLQLKATFGWSLSNLVALLRQQLFVYRDLWVWIDHPFQAPELPDALPQQLAMVWQ